MSARNMGSSDQALYALLTDMRQRIARLERRRPEGTGSGETICDCEDGAPGADGADGVDGVDGVDGADGVGMPVGGTTGQLLAKSSNSDFDTGWVSDVNDLPTLGVPGEFLGKLSNTNYDVDWLKPVPIFDDHTARDAFFTDPQFGDQCSVSESTRQFYAGAGWLAWDLDWVTYSPSSLTGITVGSGTVLARRMRQGRRCLVDFSFVLGAGSDITAAPIIALPFTAADPHGWAEFNIAGLVWCADVGVANYTGACRIKSSLTAFEPLTFRQHTGGTFVDLASISSTSPFNWASGDGLFITDFAFDLANPYV